MTQPDPPTPAPARRPYADTALTYWAAGWRGILPLPARTKKIRATGWTGNNGAWPSYPDIQTWTDGPEGDGNIALRLPPTILGIDVDHYDGKPGGLVLQQLEQQHGPLPPTWRTTSRDDGISGIRLYTIPTGLRWPGILGPGIETVRTGHRYAVTWPSTHPNGSTYRWINPDGLTAMGDVPKVTDIPPLPDAWVQALTGGAAANDQPSADLTNAASQTWLHQPSAALPPCARTNDALHSALSDLTTGASRHDAALTASNRIIWLAGEGHHGATLALATLRSAFLAATAGDREPGEAAAEWDRLVSGGINLAAAANPTPRAGDPCANPFADIIDATTPAAPATAPINHEGEPQANADSSTERTAERTTWWPQDITDALNGHREPPPTHLARTDGHAAFYPGRVNGIIGPSESGKTWIAMHAVAQAVADGDNVTILDFEDSANGVIARLLNLGVPPEKIREHVAYINPAEFYNPYIPAGLDLSEHLTQHQPALIILDGFNASMSLQGLNLLDNMDATKFFQQLLKPLAKTGATVVYIDHTPKDKDNGSSGAIGAQAKRAMTTGCTLKVEVIKPFGKGQSGKLRLYVDKDRQGDVRGVSAPSNQTHWFADFDITGRPDGSLTVTLHEPDGFDAAHPSQPRDVRPTYLMEKLSAWIAEQDDPPTQRAIREAGIGKRKEYLIKALDLLIAEGYVRTEEVSGRGGKRLTHHHVTPYTETHELVEKPPLSEVGPSGSQVGPGPTSSDDRGSGSPAPSPYGEPDPLPSVTGTPRNDQKTRSGSGATSSHCQHCGKDITTDLAAAPKLVRCRACRHLIDGSSEFATGPAHIGTDPVTGKRVDLRTGEVIDPETSP